jgi:AcrR family transcriptional regulator
MKSTRDPAREKVNNLRWGNHVAGAQAPTDQKRLAILRTAAQLFNERGFYETTLNDLAERLHVTKPSLYYYVKSKDDILVQILNTAMQEIDPAIRMAEQADVSGMEKLRMFLSHYVVVLCGDFGKCLIMSGLAPLEEESRQKLLPSYRRIDDSVRAMLEAGIEDGSISSAVDPKIAAFALFGAIHWMPTWYDASGELNSREIADRLFAIFQGGLKAPAEQARRKPAVRPAKAAKAAAASRAARAPAPRRRAG